MTSEFVPMSCRECGALLEPDLTMAEKRASSYATCVYRCEVCRIGYSNAKNPHHRRSLYEHPSGNVPTQLTAGLEKTLRGALNRRARTSKWARFGSSTSEDAVTWSVFRYLQQAGRLDRLAAVCGLAPAAGGDPSLLLWGYPVAHPVGAQVSAQLGQVCDALGEQKDSRSEPDVIVAWPHLLIIAEAKTGSPNEILKGKARDKLNRYTRKRPDIFTATAEEVRATGYYELVRNWRIAADLADRAQIPHWCLVNLGPARLETDVKKLRKVLAVPPGRIEHARWKALLDDHELPDWFERYVTSRGLRSM